MTVIAIKNLSKYYGKTKGIEKLNLEVEEGDVFGFIGPNGSGKSTTIRTLLGLISKTGGSAEIFGKDIKKYNKEILKNIGYIPSEARFYKGMKVSEIVGLSSKLQGRNCEKEAIRLYERFQLDPKKRVEELSLGNRKKVSIVCAFQHKPKLYIFDEPTSGLDPLMQNEFFKLIKERNEEGATVFLSSHVLSEIQKYCNKAAIVRNGELVACDNVENLARTQAKRVTIHGINNIDGLDGVVDLHIEKNSVDFLYKNDVKQLVSFLNDLKFIDLTITNPPLDEVFIHFYSKDGE